MYLYSYYKDLLIPKQKIFSHTKSLSKAGKITSQNTPAIIEDKNCTYGSNMGAMDNENFTNKPTICKNGLTLFFDEKSYDDAISYKTGFQTSACLNLEQDTNEPIKISIKSVEQEDNNKNNMANRLNLSNLKLVNESTYKKC